MAITAAADRQARNFQSGNGSWRTFTDRLWHSLEAIWWSRVTCGLTLFWSRWAWGCKCGLDATSLAPETVVEDFGNLVQLGPGKCQEPDPLTLRCLLRLLEEFMRRRQALTDSHHPP
jgi:hypothetical protein